jgi:hypothetical protein
MPEWTNWVGNLMCAPGTDYWPHLRDVDPLFA